MQLLSEETMTCACALRVVLLQHCSVVVMHVLEHSVQCGVEKPCRPAALGPESHQLRALGEARENCADKKTKKSDAAESLLELRLRSQPCSVALPPTVGGAGNGCQPVHADLCQLLQQQSLS